MATQPQPKPAPKLCTSCLQEAAKLYGPEPLCFGCWRRTMGAKTGTE
jgi:hypothetical protein